MSAAIARAARRGGPDHRKTGATRKGAKPVSGSSSKADPSGRAHARAPEAQTRLKAALDAQSTRAQKAVRARNRIVVVGCVFAAAFAAVAAQFAVFAADGADDPRPAPPRAEPKPPPVGRAVITDRRGAALAVNAPTYEFYLDADLFFFDHERDEAAAAVAALLPRVDEATLRRRLDEGGPPILVDRPLTPAQAQDVFELGLPGTDLQERRDRVYPGAAATFHVLGFTDIDGRGRAGVEGALNDRLQPTAGSQPAPLALTIDLRAQLALREALQRGVAEFGALGAVGVVLDARTGAVRAMVSLPDRDPHPAAPRAAPMRDGAPGPDFDRAAGGRYEFGSVFKIFTWAQALEANPELMAAVLPQPTPFEAGGRPVRDLFPIEGPVSFEDAFVRSSNIVAAQLALLGGALPQRRFFEALGLREPTGLELTSAQGVSPVWTQPWTESATAVASYGYGVSATPMHLAAAVASITNGGRRVSPRLVEPTPDEIARAPRVVSEATSRAVRRLLRRTVVEGSGRRADIPGLNVGGKTGTAEKVAQTGGYSENQVIATFAAVVPAENPDFVIVITLDEAVDRSGDKPVRFAGRTAGTVAGWAIARIAPLLGVAARPEIAPDDMAY